MATQPSPEAASLEQIDISAQLHHRPARQPDHRAENAALVRLAEVFAQEPARMARTLAHTALALTGAHAAGVSLEDEHDGQRVFRWVATAGTFERFLHETLPRDFSPCGEVLARNSALLMSRPARLYTYIGDLPHPVHEVLLVPFHERGRPVGTLWVVSHDEGKAFDAEDLRVVRNLTRFAGAALQTVGLVTRLQVVNAETGRVVDALQEADRHKDEFLAALSHEMRNPLSSINLSTQALKRLEPDAPSPQRRLLGIIERQLEQLVALVDDLTDMASIRSGKIVLRPQPLVAQDLVARALEACGPAIEARRQRLNTALPQAPVSLHGDPVRLGQVLVNLLHNAVKYTPEEGLIEVWLSATDDEVLIEVRDTGVGLSAEQLPQVFELYMQVAMGPRPQRSGLGIGLALVRQFVELHGGSVSVFSAGLGQGSRFSVRLPRRPLTAPAG